MLKKYLEFIGENNNDPWVFNGDFDVYDRNITNGKLNIKLPDVLFGKLLLSGLINLTSLEGCPKEVTELFCNKTDLISLEGGPIKVLNIYADKKFKIEKDYLKSGRCKNSTGISYWIGLLEYMISEKIDINRIKTWPKGFLTEDLIKSVSAVNKFSL